MPGRQGERVAALDGLRALAVSAVLAFHGGLSFLAGGFLGVDAFFVLSGYLITGLLLAEWRGAGRLDLLAFWARRARRLLPALVVVVLAVVACAHLLLPSTEARLLRGDALAALLYVANWRMTWRGSDYFAQTAAPSPLQHTWSLGIEEQFYLAWPLVLAALLRLRRPRRAVAAVCLLGACASLTAAALLYRPGGLVDRVYFGTDSRALPLLVGAALAVALSGPLPRRLRASFGARVTGVLALGAAVLLAWEVTHAEGTAPALYHGGLLAVALAVAAVIAHAVVVPDGLTARLLSLRPLPALGRVSYGVYLWHWPVFVGLTGARTGLSGTGLLAVRCLVTLLLAVLSYRLVEQPVRRAARRTGACLAGGLTAVGAASLVVVLVAPTARDVSAAREAGRPPGTRAIPPAPGRAGPSAGPTHHHRRRAPGAPLTVDVFGDSVAWTLVNYLPAHPGTVVRDHTMMGCGLLVTGRYRYFGSVHTPPTQCAGWPELVRRSVAADDPDVVMILFGRWETMDWSHRGGWAHLGQPDFDRQVAGELDRAVGLAGAGGAAVVLATEPYNHRGERPDGGTWPEDEPGRVDRWNALVREVAARRRPPAHVLDLGRRLCPDGRFTWDVDGVQVRSDGVHLTPDGVRWLSGWLFARLAAVR